MGEHHDIVILSVLDMVRYHLPEHGAEFLVR